MNEPHLLFVYASRDGHTRQIARRLADRLFALGHETALSDLAQGGPETEALRRADTLILMAPVRYGYALPEMRAFIKENKALIDSQHLILININLTARKPNKNKADTNPYMKKWIKKQNLRPFMAAVFAGCLDYPRYGFLDRLMIRLIMKITGGPSDGTSVVDYTDWAAVDTFADAIANKIQARRAA